MASKYKLRCSVVGHEKDVRGVIPSLYPEGGIISGSRDVTARVWTPNEHDACFTEAHVMSGHNGFVSCVCIMPPDDTHPVGLILTGSNDNTILAYTLESPAPVYKLEGHTNTVCSLAAGKFGTLISGSWDETAKVWLNQKCLMTLSGHEAAVWAVAIMPEGGFILTGSADKSIKMWKAGKCEHTFTGHDDCVRGLTVASTSEFLSCSNDATVKRWLTSGECVHTYYGHSNYVYSLALLSNGVDFVSCGEDRTLRVWRDGECDQTITHPTQSVWTVCVLGNGDVVTGASDAVIRVFSTDPGRQGDTEEQNSFENQVASSTIPAQIGDIPTDQLPGPEALVNPGKRDGQHLMVKDDNDVIMYQWSSSDSRWVKIGSVVGGSGSTQGTSGKQLYQGKEYDFVFDVELQEGAPALKLPYNLSDDPWMAAHKFLEDNEMSQMFLDQVAKFIMDQTKNIEIGPRPSTDISDPLTGGGRYIPGSQGGSTGGGGAAVSDPFTGGNRYVPSFNQQAAAPTQGTQYGADPLTGSGSYKPAGMATAPSLGENQYFPKTSYLLFEQANAKAIGKLREFNAQVDVASQITEADVDSLGKLVEGAIPGDTEFQHLSKLLQWPAGILFPVLDVLRLSIKSPAANQHFCNEANGPAFLTFILATLSPGSPTANQMLALRILVNIFNSEPGRRLLVEKRDSIISAIVSLKDSDNKNIQVALSSLLLNYSVSYAATKDVDLQAQCVSVAIMLAETLSDPEACFRLLVCFGTLVTGDKNCAKLLKSLGFESFVNRCKFMPEPTKLKECARFIEKELK